MTPIPSQLAATFAVFITATVGQIIAAAPDELRLRQWIEQLGNRSFAQREAAHKALLNQGSAILPFLSQLEPQTDAEVRSRLRRICYLVDDCDIEIVRLLDSMPDVEGTDPIPVALQNLIAEHQPKSGDVLLAIVGSNGHKLALRASRAIAQSWQNMSAQQVHAYIHAIVGLDVNCRPEYPQSVDASIGFGYTSRYSWGSWPPEEQFKLKTETAHYLDGQIFGRPFKYSGPGATTGWISTTNPKQLNLGPHICSLSMRYEFEHGGEKHCGRLESGLHPFAIVDGGVPDHLLSPSDAELDRTVRESLKFAETESDLEESTGAGGGNKRYFILEGFDQPPPDPWKPQITWGDGRNGLHMPVWKLTQPLPVDLCFAVELHDQESGKVHACDSLIVLKGETMARRGYLSPRDTFEFATGRRGFIPVKVVLKASRTAALSNTNIMQYFPNTITTDVLRCKVISDGQ